MAAWLLSAVLTIGSVEFPAAAVHAETLTEGITNSATPGGPTAKEDLSRTLVKGRTLKIEADELVDYAEEGDLTITVPANYSSQNLSLTVNNGILEITCKDNVTVDENPLEEEVTVQVSDTEQNTEDVTFKVKIQNDVKIEIDLRDREFHPTDAPTAETVYKAGGNEVGQLRQVENSVVISMTFRFDAAKSYNAGNAGLYYLLEIGDSRNNYKTGHPNDAPSGIPSYISFIARNGGNADLYCNTGSHYGSTDWAIGGALPSFGDGNLHTLTVSISPDAMNMYFDNGELKTVTTATNKNTKNFIASFLGQGTGSTYSDWRSDINMLTIGDCYELAAGRHNNYGRFGGEIKSVVISDGTFSAESLLADHKSFGTEIAKKELQKELDNSFTNNSELDNAAKDLFRETALYQKVTGILDGSVETYAADIYDTTSELSEALSDPGNIGLTEIGGSISNMFNTDLDNTWLFGGGAETQGRFSEIAGMRNYIGQFEEYVRWTKAGNNNQGMQRYTINAGKAGADAAAFAGKLDDYIEKLDPKAVSYLIGPEDYKKGQEGISAFQTALTSIIQKSLAMKDGAGYVVIALPHAVPEDQGGALAESYALAAKNTIRSYIAEHKDQKDRIVMVDHMAMTSADENFAANCLTSEGLLNGNGHYELAKEFSLKTYGSIANFPAIRQRTAEDMPKQYENKRPSVTAAAGGSLNVVIPADVAAGKTQWDYTVSAGDVEICGTAQEGAGRAFTIPDLPEGKDYVLTLKSHDNGVCLAKAYGTLTAGKTGGAAQLSPLQQKIREKAEDTGKPLTWLFMGDSITHGAMHTGGYDSVAQVFEKYLKEDLGRTDDIVINTAVSGSTAQSTIDRIEERLNKYTPDIVSIMIGTNDIGNNQYSAINSSQYTSRLETIVSAIRARNQDALIIFRSPTPANPTSHGNRTRHLESWMIQAMRRNAEKDGNILFIDQYTEWREELKVFPYLYNNAASDFYYNDALHPNEIGQLRMAKQFIRECGLNTDTKIANLSYPFTYTEHENNAQPNITAGRSRIALETAEVEHLQMESNMTFGSLEVTVTDPESGRTYTKKSYTADGRIVIPSLPNGGNDGKTYTVSVTGTSATNAQKVKFADKEITLSEQNEVLPYYVFLDRAFIRDIAEGSVAAKFYTGPAAPESGHSVHAYQLVADDAGNTYDNGLFTVDGDTLKIKQALKKNRTYSVCVQAVHADDGSGCSQKSVYQLRTTPTLEEIRADAALSFESSNDRRALDLDLAGVSFADEDYVELGEEDSTWYEDGKYLEVLNNLRQYTTGGTILYRFRTEQSGGLIFGSGSHKTSVNNDNTIMAFGLFGGETRGIFRAPASGLRGNFNSESGGLDDGRWHTVAISFDTTKTDFQNQTLISVDGSKNCFLTSWWTANYKTWFNQNQNQPITHFAIGGGACTNSVFAAARLDKFKGEIAFVTVTDQVYTEEELKMITRTDYITGEQDINISGTVVNLPQGAHYTASPLVWDEDGAGAEFTLTAEDGYLFDANVSAVISNGAGLSMTEHTQMEFSPDDKSVKVTFRTTPWRTDAVFDAEEITVTDGVSDGAAVSTEIIEKLGAMRRGSVTIRYKLDDTAVNADGRLALFSLSNGEPEGYSAFFVAPSTGAVGYAIQNQKGNAGMMINADEAAREDIQNQNWHTVTYVFSAVGTEVYLDGNRILANTTVGFLRNTDNTSHAQIGSVYCGANQANAFPFSGEINMLQVTYDTLNADEVARLHAATTPKALELPEDAVKTEATNLYYEGYDNSPYYRMPSLLTTSAGVIIAAADKRQTTEADRGNIDTVVRRSTDAGKTWSDPKTIFNQPDGGTMYSFTTAPTMVEDQNGRIHMIANLFPESQGRLATGLIEKGSGFKEVNGKLYPILRNYANTALNAEDTWDKEYTIRENGVVYEEKETGAEATEYKVPEYLAANGGGDLFRGDDNTPCGNIYVYTGSNAGELKMPRVMSVVSCYSDDNGTTWEGYRNITGMIKEDWMKFMRVGPGAGIRLEHQSNTDLNGRIVIPVCYTNGDGIYSYAAGLIYSDDNGETWKRTESPISQVEKVNEQEGTFRDASLRESQIVEMNDGTIKMVSLNYSGHLKLSTGTFEENGITWSSVQKTTIQDLGSPISFIHAPRSLDGKEAVLLSAPLGPGSNNGYIHIGLHQADGTFEWKYLRKIKADGFGNSCMSALDNEIVGILYKGTKEDIAFTSMNDKWFTSPRYEAFTTPVIKNIEMNLDGTGLVFTVTFDSAFMKKGTPVLNLKLNKTADAQAAYVSGSGTGVYTFRYDMGDQELWEIEAVNVAAKGTGYLENAAGLLPEDVSYTFEINRDVVAEAIRQALAKYKTLYDSDGTGYDETLFQKFRKAYEDAQEAVGNENAPVNELQQILKALNNAAEALGSGSGSGSDDNREDTIQEIEKELEDCRDLYESEGSEYDPELFQKFKEAYENLQEALERGDEVSTSDLSELLKAFELAKNALDGTTDDTTEALKALNDALLAYKDTYEKNRADYTAETWNVFEAAYAAAKRAVDEGTAGRAELEQLKKDLDDSYKALKKAVKVEEEKRQLAAPAITLLTTVAEKNRAGVKIQVSKVDGADLYTVYRITGGSLKEIGRTDAGGIAYDENPVSKKTASYYAVAESSTGKYKKSANGAAKTIVVDASVKKIKAKRVGKKFQVRLSWKKVKNAQKYMVYRSTTKDSGYTMLKTLKKKATSFVDKKAKKGNTYYYRIVIKTKKGYSGVTTSKGVKIKK